MNDIQELVVELTDGCPLKCRHCSSDSGPQCHTHLRGECVRRLVLEASELGAAQVSLGGGEPASSPLFLETLELVDSLGLRSEVFTCGNSRSGTAIRPLPDSLIRDAAKVHGTKFIFSFHGPNQDLHDYITDTPGSFECMMLSLQACMDAGIECEANFVALRPNVQSFPELVRLVEQLGLRKLSVLRFVPQGRGFENRSELELTNTEEDTFVEALLDLRKQTPVEIRTGSPFNGIVPGNNTPCRAGVQKLVVQANGNVLPCEVFKAKDRRNWALSVYTMSLSQILSSQQLKGFRGSLARNPCMDCPIHIALRTRQPSGAPDGRPQMATQAW